MKEIRWIVLWFAVILLLPGCGKKTVTVADILTEDEEGVYIEMKDITLKEKGEEKEEGASVKHCAVLIPAGYRESEEVPGMYLHEKHPLDSSNIYYAVSDYDTGSYEPLTEESYEKAMESAYSESRGEELNLTIESFEKENMQGFPAYVIRSSHMVGDHKIEQLVYLIAADKIYTVTFSQAADDELLADFEVGDGRIRLVIE